MSADADKCPAWEDGQHLFWPGQLVERLHNPYSKTVVGESFRPTDGDDHCVEAKSCRCGKVIRATKDYRFMGGKRGYIPGEPAK